MRLVSILQPRGRGVQFAAGAILQHSATPTLHFPSTSTNAKRDAPGERGGRMATNLKT
jgi:hypothetical protein